MVLDAEGKEHLLMRFYVEGPNNEGVAHLEMVKDQRNKWEYKYLFVDIPGKQKSTKREKKMPQNPPFLTFASPRCLQELLSPLLYIFTLFFCCTLSPLLIIYRLFIHSFLLATCRWRPPSRACLC